MFPLPSYYVLLKGTTEKPPPVLWPHDMAPVYFPSFCSLFEPLAHYLCTQLSSWLHCKLWGLMSVFPLAHRNYLTQGNLKWTGEHGATHWRRSGPPLRPTSGACKRPSIPKKQRFSQHTSGCLAQHRIVTTMMTGPQLLRFHSSTFLYQLSDLVVFQLPHL